MGYIRNIGRSIQYAVPAIVESQLKNLYLLAKVLKDPKANIADVVTENLGEHLREGGVALRTVGPQTRIMFRNASRVLKTGGVYDPEKKAQMKQMDFEGFGEIGSGDAFGGGGPASASEGLGDVSPMGDSEDLSDIFGAADDEPGAGAQSVTVNNSTVNVMKETSDDVSENIMQSTMIGAAMSSKGTESTTQAVLGGASIQVEALSNMSGILNDMRNQDNRHYEASAQFLGNISDGIGLIADEIKILRAFNMPREAMEEGKEAELTKIFGLHELDSDEGSRFDLKLYTRYLGQKVQEKGLGFIANILSSELKKFAVGPFEKIIDAAAGKAFGVGFLKDFKDFVKHFPTTTLINLREIIESQRDEHGELGFFGKVLDFFNIRGPTVDSLEKVLDKNYKLDPIPFDGETKRSIVEVIPTYLSRILSALTNEDEMKDRFFDQTHGTYTTREKVYRDYAVSRSDALGFLFDNKSLMGTLFRDHVRERLEGDEQGKAAAFMAETLGKLGAEGRNFSPKILRQMIEEQPKTELGQKQAGYLRLLKDATDDLDADKLFEFNREMLKVGETLNRNLQEFLSDDLEYGVSMSHRRAALADREAFKKFMSRGGIGVGFGLVEDPDDGPGGGEPPPDVRPKGPLAGLSPKMARDAWMGRRGDGGAAMAVPSPVTLDPDGGKRPPKSFGDVVKEGSPMRVLTDFLGRTYNIAKGHVKEHYDKFSKWVKTRIFGDDGVYADIKGWLKENVLGNWKRFMDWTNENVWTPFKNWLFKDGGILERIRGGVAKSIRWAYDHIRDGWQGSMDFLRKKVWDPMTDALLGKDGLLTDFKRKVRENFWEPTKEVFRNFMDKTWTPVKNWVQDTMKASWSRLFDKKDGVFGEKFRKRFSETFIDPVKNWLWKDRKFDGKSLVRKYVVDPFRKHVGDPLMEFLHGTEGSPGFFTRVGNFFKTNIADPVSRFLWGDWEKEGIFDRFSKNLNKVLFGGDGRQGVVDKYLKPIGEYFKVHIKDPFVETVKSQWENLKDFMRKSVMDPMKESFKGLGTTLKNLVVEGWNEGRDLFKESFKHVTDKWREMLDGAGEGIGRIMKENVLDPIKEALDSVRKALFGMFKNIVMFPVNVIRSATDSMKIRDLKMGRGGHLDQKERDRLLDEYNKRSKDKLSKWGDQVDTRSDKEKKAADARAKSRADRKEGKKEGYFAKRRRMREERETAKAEARKTEGQKQTGEMKKGNETLDRIREAVADAKDKFGKHFEDIRETLSSTKDNLKNHFEDLRSTVKDSFEAVSGISVGEESKESKAHRSKMSDMLGKTLDKVSDMAKDVSDILTEVKAIRRMMGGKEGVGAAPGESKFRKFMRGLLRNPIRLVKSLAGTAFNMVKGLLDRIWQPIKKAGEWIVKGVRGIIKLPGKILKFMKDTVKEVWETVGPVVKSGMEFIGNVVSGLGKSIKDFMGGIGEKLGEMMGGIMEGVGKVARGIGKMAAEAFKLLAPIGEFFKDVLEAGLKVGSWLVQGVAGVLKSAIGGIFGQPWKQDVFVRGGWLNNVYKIGGRHPLDTESPPKKGTIESFKERMRKLKEKLSLKNFRERSIELARKTRRGISSIAAGMRNFLPLMVAGLAGIGGAIVWLARALIISPALAIGRGMFRGLGWLGRKAGLGGFFSNIGSFTSRMWKGAGAAGMAGGMGMGGFAGAAGAGAAASAAGLASSAAASAAGSAAGTAAGGKSEKKDGGKKKKSWLGRRKGLAAVIAAVLSGLGIMAMDDDDDDSEGGSPGDNANLMGFGLGDVALTAGSLGAGWAATKAIRTAKSPGGFKGTKTAQTFRRWRDAAADRSAKGWAGGDRDEAERRRQERNWRDSSRARASGGGTKGPGAWMGGGDRDEAERRRQERNWRDSSRARASGGGAKGPGGGWMGGDNWRRGGEGWGSSERASRSGTGGKKSFLGKGMNFLKKTPPGAFALTGVSGAIISGLSEGMDEGFAKDAISTVGSTMQFAGWGGALGSFIPGVGTLMGAGIGTIVGLAYNAIDLGKKHAKDGWERMVGWGKDAWTSVSKVASDTWRAIKEKAKDVWSGKPDDGSESGSEDDSGGWLSWGTKFFFPGSGGSKWGDDDREHGKYLDGKGFRPKSEPHGGVKPLVDVGDVSRDDGYMKTEAGRLGYIRHGAQDVSVAGASNIVDLDEARRMAERRDAMKLGYLGQGDGGGGDGSMKGHRVMMEDGTPMGHRLIRVDGDGREAEAETEGVLKKAGGGGKSPFRPWDHWSDVSKDEYWELTPLQRKMWRQDKWRDETLEGAKKQGSYKHAYVHKDVDKGVGYNYDMLNPEDRARYDADVAAGRVPGLSKDDEARIMGVGADEDSEGFFKKAWNWMFGGDEDVDAQQPPQRVKLWNSGSGERGWKDSGSGERAKLWKDSGSGERAFKMEGFRKWGKG